MKNKNQEGPTKEIKHSRYSILEMERQDNRGVDLNEEGMMGNEKESQATILGNNFMLKGKGKRANV